MIVFLVRRWIGWLSALALMAAVAVASKLAAGAGAPTAAGQKVAVGEELFQANCAACHGPSAEGMGAAPALGGVVDRLGRDGVEATIREGRGGMPPFGDRLTDEQIADVAAFLDTLPPQATAHEPRGRRPMMEGMWEHMPWDGMMTGLGWLVMLLWVLFSVALLVLVVLAVVWLARNLGSDRGQRSAGAPPAGGSGSPRDALDLRYARGEINREEYLQARQDLEGPHQ